MRSRLFIFVLLAISTTVARAADSEARRLVADGIHLRDDKNDYEGALKLFQRAYQLEPSAMTLGQIATAEYFLRHWDESEEYLTAALADTSNEWVSRYRGMLEKMSWDVRQHVGDLVVSGGAPGAQLYVNGRPRGVLPLAKALRVSEGQAAIQVTAAGYQPFVGSATVVAGAVNQLNVSMEKLRLVEVPAAARPADQGTSHLRAAAWVAAGGSAVSLGVGIAGQLVRDHRLDDFNKSCRLNADNGNKPMRFPAGVAGPDPCQGLYDSWNSSKPWPVIGYAAAGAFAVTSAVLFLMSRETATPDKHAGIDCGVGTGFFGCRGVF